MNFKLRLTNAVSVRLSKLIANRIPLSFIWLQDNIVSNVLGSLLNKKLHDVDIELSFSSEIVSYHNVQALSETCIKQVGFADCYLVAVHNAYLSPLSGLCWRRNQYFTQSVGTVTSCFGYRTAFRQLDYPPKKGCQVIENGFVVVSANNISHFLLEDLPVLIEIANRRIPVTVIVRLDALRVVNEILETCFDPKLDILRTDNVVTAKRAYFITRSEEPPFVRGQYVDLLRRYFLSSRMLMDRREDESAENSRIYISRTKSRIRPIENEMELEDHLRAKGYSLNSRKSCN